MVFYAFFIHFLYSFLFTVKSKVQTNFCIVLFRFANRQINYYLCTALVPPELDAGKSVIILYQISIFR